MRPKLTVRAMIALAGCLLPVLLLAGGCERKEKPPAASGARAPTTQPETAPAPPEYLFAAGLEERFPEVSRFLRRFVETALAHDYMAYRRLVSRRADPESRERFEQALAGLQRLTVEEVEAIDHPELPADTHRVVVRVEFRPGEAIALRRGDENRIAILVFPEEGELRMSFAPPVLQPQRQPTTDEAEEAVPTTQPDYPWDDGIDY